MIVTFYYKQKYTKDSPLPVRYDISPQDVKRLKADFQSYLTTGAPSSGSYECTTVKGDPGLRKPRATLFIFEQIAAIE